MSSHPPLTQRFTKPTQVLHCPLYDTITIRKSTQQAYFFRDPVGSADADAPVGVKTFNETNVRMASSLPVPQSFDIDSILIVPDYRSCMETEREERLLDALGDPSTRKALRRNTIALRSRSNVNVEVGQKSFLRINADAVISASALLPGEEPQEVDPNHLVAKDHDPEKIVASLRDAFKVSTPMPEGSVTLKRGLGMVARRNPIHIESQQQFGVSIEILNGAPETIRLRCYLDGLLHREWY